VQGSGSQFDPRVVEAFITIPDDAFERIARDVK
jgi:response regulator RpfG family c-di-GMP phosphodiesterase